MSTLFELVTQVKDIVRRPDMATLVEQRVIAAIRACHQSAPCDRDLIEDVAAVVDAPQAVGTAPYSGDFRTLEPDIAGCDVDGNIICTLRKVSTSELAKLRVMGKDVDTYYIVNNSISFKARAPLHTLVIAGYVYCPPASVLLDEDGVRLPIEELTSPGTYTDWITENHDTAIINYAVGYIEGLKGNRELAASHLDVFEKVDKPELVAIAATLSGK